MADYLCWEVPEAVHVPRLYAIHCFCAWFLLIRSFLAKNVAVRFAPAFLIFSHSAEGRMREVKALLKASVPVVKFLDPVRCGVLLSSLVLRTTTHASQRPPTWAGSLSRAVLVFVSRSSIPAPRAHLVSFRFSLLSLRQLGNGEELFFFAVTCYPSFYLTSPRFSTFLSFCAHLQSKSEGSSRSAGYSVPLPAPASSCWSVRLAAALKNKAAKNKGRECEVPFASWRV